MRHYSGFTEEYFTDMQTLREKVDYERRVELQNFNKEDMLPMFQNMQEFVEQQNPSHKTLP